VTVSGHFGGAHRRAVVEHRRIDAVARRGNRLEQLARHAHDSGVLALLA